MKNSEIELIYDKFLSSFILRYASKEKFLDNYIKSVITRDKLFIEELKSKVTYLSTNDIDNLTYQIKHKKSKTVRYNNFVKFINNYIEELNNRNISELVDYSNSFIRSIINISRETYPKYISIPKDSKLISKSKNKLIFNKSLKDIINSWNTRRIHNFIYTSFRNSKLNNYELQKSISDLYNQTKNPLKSSIHTLRAILRANFTNFESAINQEIYEVNNGKIDFIYSNVFEKRNNKDSCKKLDDKLIHRDLNGVYPPIHPNCVTKDTKVNYNNDFVEIYKSVGRFQILNLKFSNNVTLKCTKDHRLLTMNRGFVEAQHIQKNDILSYTRFEDSTKIISTNSENSSIYNEKNTYIVTLIEKKVDFYENVVYNCETISNIYYTNGLISHNCRKTSLPTFRISNKLYWRPSYKDINSWFDSQTNLIKIKIIGIKNYNLYNSGNFDFTIDYLHEL